MAERRRLFGVTIDAVDMQQAVHQLREWIEGQSVICRYVVTPNVDHAVMLQHDLGLHKSYQDADLVLADGHPIVWASRLLGQPLPQRVPGSELVPQLFNSFNRSGQLRVFLLGAAPGVAAVAASRIIHKWPRIEVVGVYSPPCGFETDQQETNMILGRIALARPDVIVIGLGAPKQEVWVHQNRRQLCAKVALCVGATIDFLAGKKHRAPVWMQRSGIEWLHRLLHEPRRLGRRYANDAWVFPRLIWRQWISQ